MSARFDVKSPILIEVEWDVLAAKFALSVHLYLRHESGVTVFCSMDNLDSPWRNKIAPQGRYRGHCLIPPHFLNEGMFTIEYLICTSPTTSEYCTFPDAVTFYVIDDMRNEGVRGQWAREWPMSIMRPRLQWTFYEPCPLLAREVANALSESKANGR